MARKGIDVSNFSFESYREKGFLYIDKTEYIWNLINNGSAYFLARPRRFGKSMLLSTMEAYFLGKKELFKGLAIERLTGKDWDTYPVIHLVMSEVSGGSVDEIEKGLRSYLASKARELNLQIENGSAAIQLRSLIEELNRSTQKQVVVLIDEYDKPILNVMHLGTDIKEEVLAYMRDFYQVIKNQNAREHFVFVTGISRFSRVSLFSEMNNLIDITQKKEYATMLGFTEEELDRYFEEDIQRAAEKFNTDPRSIRRAMKAWYDGFRFACCDETVYTPVSIGNFFSNLEFRNFWYDTGTPSFLVNTIKDKPFLLEEFTKTWTPAEQLNTYDINDVNPLALAIQTGYLTIAEWQQMPDFTIIYRYDFPNNEIRDCWNKGILAMVTNMEEYEVGAMVGRLKRSIADFNAANFMTELTTFFRANDYSNVGDVNEGFYRLMMQTLLSLVGLPVEVEARQALSRNDLAAISAGNAFVFELKVCRKGDNPQHKLQEATTQIKQKNYSSKYSVFCHQVQPIAIVFNDVTHTIETWEAIPPQEYIAPDDYHKQLTEMRGR